MRDTYLTNHSPSRLSGKDVDDFDPPAVSAEEWHRRHEAKIAAMAGEVETHEAKVQVSEKQKQLNEKTKATTTLKRNRTRTIAQRRLEQLTDKTT